MLAIRNNIVVTLSTGGHEQDVQAMLELYSDLIDPSEPPTDQKTTQKIGNEPQSVPQNEKYEPQGGIQKLLEAVRLNPKITKAALSELLGVSSSTLKRWMKANGIVWVGHSKNVHWEILGKD